MGQWVGGGVKWGHREERASEPCILLLHEPSVTSSLRQGAARKTPRTRSASFRTRWLLTPGDARARSGCSPAPDRGREGGTLWSDTHCQELQQGKVPDPDARRHDAVVHKLAHPATPFPPLHFCPRRVSAAACRRGVCVCVCVCRTDDAAGSLAALSSAPVNI